MATAWLTYQVQGAKLPWVRQWDSSASDALAGAQKELEANDFIQFDTRGESHILRASTVIAITATTEAPAGAGRPYRAAGSGGG